MHWISFLMRFAVHVSLLLVLLLSYPFYPDTTYRSVYNRPCVWRIQCLKDQKFQKRKWNLLNVLSAFCQTFNGMQIIIFCKCPELFMQFDNGVEFSWSIRRITKCFEEFYRWFGKWTPRCLCPWQGASFFIKIFDLHFW